MRKFVLKITRHQPTDRGKMNINEVFKVVLESFIRIGKITFTVPQLVATSFQDTKVTRADWSFPKFDQFVTLRLKTSNTDVNHTGVFIVIDLKH